MRESIKANRRFTNNKRIVNKRKRFETQAKLAVTVILKCNATTKLQNMAMLAAWSSG